MAEEGMGTSEIPPGEVTPEIPPGPEIVTPKRGPGRPRKNPEQVKTESVGGASGEAKKSKPGKSKLFREEDKTALADQIKGLHEIVAMMTGLPFVAINEKEALMLSHGIVAVAEEYGLSLTGKTGAFIQLLGAAGLVYGPRIFMFKAAQAQARQQARAPQTVEGQVSTNGQSTPS